MLFGDSSIITNYGTLNSDSFKSIKRKMDKGYQHKYEEKESMEDLRWLALAIQQMDEMQRLRTLKWVVQKETSGKDNRFWLTIAKVLQMLT